MPLSLPYRLLPDRQSLRLFSLWVHWHCFFAINIPIGIAALVIGLIYLPDNPVKLTGRRFDKFSCLMNAVTFGLLIFSLEGITHKKTPR